MTSGRSTYVCEGRRMSNTGTHYAHHSDRCECGDDSAPGPGELLEEASEKVRGLFKGPIRLTRYLTTLWKYFCTGCNRYINFSFEITYQG